MIRNYSQFIKESQSKKISKYVDFSTFLKWYNENRKKIANILEVDSSELATEDEILKQSSDLIEKIINRQSSGNYGREGTKGDLDGFNAFEPLTNHIAHDILHNIYNVTKKNFDNYDEYDFNESENIEEIEVLAIEESLMKYFKMDYVKSDFVHQNINRLVGFLMMTIIQNDPQRILDILDGKIEPYVEVYDEKYPIKGTPFENLYEIIHQIPIDPVRKPDTIKNGQDFKDWLGYMKLYSDAIDYEENSDRANFPYSDFLGAKQMHELTDEEFEEFVGYDHTTYDEDHFEGADFGYDLVIRDMVISEWPDLPGSISDVFDLQKKVETDDIPKKLKDEIDVLKNDRYSNWTRFEFQQAYKVDADDDDHNLFSDNSEWLLIFEDSDDTLYKTYDGDFNELDTKVGIYDDVTMTDLCITDMSLEESYWEVQWDYIKDIEEEIDFDHHTDDIETNTGSMKYTDTLRALTRRYFRYNDVLVNNTKIKQKGGNYTFIKDSLFDNYKSLSKNPLTENAKRLIRIFNEFRGWTIKNFDMLKKTHKKVKSVFSKEDLELIAQYETNIRIIKFNIYNNLDKIEKYTNAKVEAKLSEVASLFSKSSNVKGTIDTFKKYQKLFNQFDSEIIFNYLKRVPNLNIENVKKDIHRFDDMFVQKFIEDYEKCYDKFINISDIEEHRDELFKKLMEFTKEFGNQNIGHIRFYTKLRELNIKKENFNDLIDMYESFIKNKCPNLDIEIERSRIEPIYKDEILEAINTGDNVFYSVECYKSFIYIIK